MSLFVIFHLKNRIYCRDAMEYRQLRSDRANYSIQIICLFCMNKYNHPEASPARGDPRRWGRCRSLPFLVTFIFMWLFTGDCWIRSRQVTVLSRFVVSRLFITTVIPQRPLSQATVHWNCILRAIITVPSNYNWWRKSDPYYWND